jgi:hypothetical protein
MVFYIDSRGCGIDEYLAGNGEYIGMLGNPSGDNISPSDISIEKINEKLNNNKFLVCLILNNTWWVCVLFNTSDGAKEVKSKYKGKQMLWYWLDREHIKRCLPNMQYKEFEKIFPNENTKKE